MVRRLDAEHRRQVAWKLVQACQKLDGPATVEELARVARVSPRVVGRVLSDLGNSYVLVEARPRKPKQRPALTEAQQALVLSSLNQAKGLAGRGARRGIDDDDRLSDAYLALCHSALAFDPARGLRFTTLVQTSVVRSLASTKLRCRRCRKRLGQGGGDMENVRDPGDPEPSDALVDLIEALGTLSQQERDILRLRFRENMTLDHIGNFLFLPRREIDRKYRGALKKLRTLLED